MAVYQPKGMANQEIRTYCTLLHTKLNFPRQLNAATTGGLELNLSFFLVDRVEQKLVRLLIKSSLTSRLQSLVHHREAPLLFHIVTVLVSVL